MERSKMASNEIDTRKKQTSAGGHGRRLVGHSRSREEEATVRPGCRSSTSCSPATKDVGGKAVK
jgi:hypothetical protein